MTRRRARLDAELVRRNIATSRTEAQRLIAEGRVTVDGAPALKAATLVTTDAGLGLEPGGERYASRGGHKLAGALDRLDVTVPGRHCLDAGASTGGFTDVLLRGGAAHVVAVDVGYGQLAWRLQTDERVTVLDRTNVRHLAPERIPGPPPSLVVADLSFISLTRVMAALTAVADADADHLLLTKPQFEVGPQRVGRGGVVRDPVSWRRALDAVVGAAEDRGLGLAGAVVSPVPGPAGNVEFFVLVRAGAGADVDRTLDAAVREGVALVRRPPP